MSGARLRLTAVAVLVACVGFASFADATEGTGPYGVQSLDAGPARAKSAVPLASGALRETVARLSSGQPAPQGVDLGPGGSVRVEVLHRLGAAGVSGLLAQLGVTRIRTVGDDLAEAFVPVERLVELERANGVDFVRPPLITQAPPAEQSARRATRAQPYVGQQLGKTNARNWHSVGRRGAGVGVGIIDSFGGPALAAAVAAREVPSPSGVFCMNGGAACDFTTQPNSFHGVGVAEIVHEMAPGARLYLATTGPSSVADLQGAVDFFAARRVRVLSRSLTGEFDGPGNGTGPTASVVEYAAGRGMLWVNSAGNTAGGGQDPGAYWRGGWYDPDNDGWLNFFGTDELLDFDCAFVNGLRWSDWGSFRTDYDVYVYKDAGATVLGAKSENYQGLGAPPLEHVNSQLSCSSGQDIDYLAVKLYQVGGGTEGDVIEFQTNGDGVQYWSNPYSGNQPASDSGSVGAMSVGAIDPPLGTTIAAYSGQGPTNDGRVKPDIVAPACVSSFIYRPDCFDGTSAATPVVAGAAALVAGAAPTWSPFQIKAFLLGNAFDRGQPGADNIYGSGELRLPAIIDRVRPTVRAFAARGRYGGRLRLIYRVNDNSGRTRERVQVFRRSRRIRSIPTAWGIPGTYNVRWRAPRGGSGYRFCVRAFDPRGNSSRLSCAPIRLR